MGWVLLAGQCGSSKTPEAYAKIQKCRVMDFCLFSIKENWSWGCQVNDGQSHLFTWKPLWSQERSDFCCCFKLPLQIGCCLGQVFGFCSGWLCVFHKTKRLALRPHAPRNHSITQKAFDIDYHRIIMLYSNCEKEEVWRINKAWNQNIYCNPYSKDHTPFLIDSFYILHLCGVFDERDRAHKPPVMVAPRHSPNLLEVSPASNLKPLCCSSAWLRSLALAVKSPSVPPSQHPA